MTSVIIKFITALIIEIRAYLFKVERPTKRDYNNIKVTIAIIVVVVNLIKAISSLMPEQGGSMWSMLWFWVSVFGLIKATYRDLKGGW